MNWITQTKLARPDGIHLERLDRPTIDFEEHTAPGDWIRSIPKNDVIFTIDYEEIANMKTAIVSLQATIDIDPEIRSGVPVLKGTRFPLSRLFAELANCDSLAMIADEWDLDVELIKQVLQGMALCLDHPRIAQRDCIENVSTR